MDSVIRVIAMYLFLMLVFRVAGKRVLSEDDTFDFLTLLIISETTQQAMVGHDHSLINACILSTTLVGLTILFSLIKQKSKLAAKILDDVPMVVVEHGRALKQRMNKLRVDEDDVLQAARELQGLERLEQIKYAVVERDGSISIVPAAA